jgi:hypothetical protein
VADIKVIFDNDSLAHLAFINASHPVIGKLRNIFSAIHIPDEILIEFENNHNKNPERQDIIVAASKQNSFFRKCSSFDLLIKSFLLTHRGIDMGEAAAAAQHYRIHSRYIVSEDIKFHKQLNSIYPDIKVIKLKHVFAMLDILGYLENWNECIVLLHKRRHFTSQELRDVYIEVAEIYGKTVNKKELSLKTGFKNLGIPVK